MLITRAGLILFFGCMFGAVLAQSQKLPKRTKCLLKGRWRLTETFSGGTAHAVDRSSYNAVLHFKALHHFSEEVFYESNHWIISGKWHVSHQKASLDLSERKYIIGKLEDSPPDIHYTLFELNKHKWRARATVKGEEVKVYFQKGRR